MIKYLYKDSFAVIGKAGQGIADNPQKWVMPLWEEANSNFIEVESLIRKNKSSIPLIWGAMNDIEESNKRWGEAGKYMASGEADVDAIAPEGWTKWIIPAQTYLVVSCTMDKYGDVFKGIVDKLGPNITGCVHEYYPEPGNPNTLDIYFPIAQGKILCQACDMPMTKPEDFGLEVNGDRNSNYCLHCYDRGALLRDVTMDRLITDVQALVDIEAKHPNLLSTPLLSHIKGWLALESISAKATAISSLYLELIDGQDADMTGTQWEEEWLSDGMVCHCIACIAARKCISDIKLMRVDGYK